MALSSWHKKDTVVRNEIYIRPQRTRKYTPEQEAHLKELVLAGHTVSEAVRISGVPSCRAYAMMKEDYDLLKKHRENKERRKGA